MMEIGIYIDITLKYQSRFDYVIEFINNHPIVKNTLFVRKSTLNDSRLFYGIKKRKGVLSCKAQLQFFSQSFINTKSLQCSAHQYKDVIYFAANKVNSNEPISNEYIPFDLFETIFFHVSRIEEVTLPFKNYIGKKGKFEKELYSIKHNIYQIPVVDHLVLLLKELLLGVPDSIVSVLGLSHDVDIIQKFKHPLTIFKKLGGLIKNRKSIKALPYLFNQYIDYLKNGKDPFYNFEQLLISEPESKDIYFIAGGNHYWDTPFPLGDRFLRIIELAKSYDYTLGIHPSHDSWNNPDLLIQEKQNLEKAINQPVTISRQHFLNFDITITPQLLISAGIQRDSSLGYSRHIGFRCGTGFDYYLYDFKKEMKSDLVERPLVFMDIACLYQSNFNNAKFVRLMNEFIQMNKYNTQIYTLFHNSFMDEAMMRNIKIWDLYKNLFKCNKKS